MKQSIDIKLLLCGLVCFSGLLSSAESKPSSGSVWNAALPDADALGGLCIASHANDYRAPRATATNRVARYRVPFAQPGAYDLYARLKGPKPTLYYSKVFGDADAWQEVKKITLPGGEYTWVNLSERFGSKKSGDNTFTVTAPGTVTFSIASRTRGPRIDAFAFGTASATFTDAQLDAAVTGGSTTAGLIGFQAESAVAFGTDTMTDAGLRLMEKYVEIMQSLKAEIEKHLPAIDEAKVAVWMNAIKAEEGLAKEAAAKAKVVAKMQAAEGKLRKLEENQKYAPKTIADAKAKLQRAKALPDSDPDKEKALAHAEKFLSLRQRECDALPGTIEKAKAAVKQAEADLPAAIKEAEAAEAAHKKAMAATWKAMDALGSSGILGSDQLDGKLAQYMIIKEATFRGLAAFGEKSAENEKLIQQLFANKALMIQMLVADGPNAGRYGEAMKIYTAIQKAGPRAKQGVFQRLALATALVNAKPITLRQPEIEKDKIEYVDPVKRYLNYEKWYLDGELDQGFRDLSVWNLAMVVGGNDPDEIYAWGRKMLHNLRPDCIPTNGDTSVYVDVVDKEIAYTSSMVKNDLPELHFKQNILANGGICGRRAFFGRFILRAFGVPTTARKQPGHATLAHWHPDGWKTRLGGGWGRGARDRYSTMNRTRSSPYGADVNFLASSQAREDAAAFIRVKRAQWIGALVGEEPMMGFVSRSKKKVDPASAVKTAFWNMLALYEQKRIIAGLDEESGESQSTASVAAKEPTATGKVTADDKGVITIPSAACSNPTRSTKTLFHATLKDLIVFVKNKLGDTLLHLSRYSTENDSFEYEFDAPKAGKYELTANLVTPKPNQQITVSANGNEEVIIELPYTLGMWDTTKPVVVDLVQGKNTLKFTGPARMTVDHFTLTPVK